MQAIKVDSDLFERYKNKPDTLRVLMALLFQSDDNGVVSVSISGLGRSLGIERHAINRIIDSLVSSDLITKHKVGNKVGNFLGNIIINDIESYKISWATKRATKRATPKPEKEIVKTEPNEVTEVVDLYLDRMKSTYPTVMRLDKPLQETEYDRLVVKFGRDAVEEVLMSMENRKTLLKEYTSAYSTALQWLKRRHPENNGKETYLEANNKLLGRFGNEQGTYGAFLAYLSSQFVNVWSGLPAPTEMDFLNIMSDVSKRGYLVDILKRMDGDAKSREYSNFYSAYVKVFETILRYESVNTRIRREQSERDDALRRQQEAIIRDGAEDKGSVFGNY